MGGWWWWGGDATGRALHDAVLRQVAQLHVPKGLPGTDHRDVRAQTLHPGDVVAEAAKHRSKLKRLWSRASKVSPVFKPSRARARAPPTNGALTPSGLVWEPCS